MFGKLVTKLHHTGIHTVGTLNDFLLSSDSEDENDDGVVLVKKPWEVMQQRKRKNDRIKAKYSRKKRETKYLSHLGHGKSRGARRWSTFKMKRTSKRLDPVKVAKEVQHQLPLDWNSPFDKVNFYSKDKRLIDSIHDIKTQMKETEERFHKHERDRYMHDLHMQELKHARELEVAERILADNLEKSKYKFVNSGNWSTHQKDTQNIIKQYTLDAGDEKKKVEMQKRHQSARDEFVQSCLHGALVPEVLCFPKEGRDGMEGIDLNGFSLGNKYCKLLGKIKKLFTQAKYVKMRNNGMHDATTGQILKSCIGNDKIESIDLSNNKFGFRSAYYLIKLVNHGNVGLKALRLHDVSLDDHTSSVILECLGKKAADDWMIKRCPRTLQEWRALKFGKAIKKRVMSKEEVLQKNLFVAMKKIDHLALKSKGSINLDGFRGRAVDVVELRRVLKYMGCRVSAPETEALMTIFDLDGNGHIDYKEFVKVFFSRVRAMKRGETTLVGPDGRDVYSVNRSDTELAAVPDRIMGSSLTYIDLSCNNIGTSPRCINGLVEMLKHHPSLQNLNLGWNRFGSKCCRPLAKAMVLNRSLKRVDLSWNNIGEGVNSLATMLSKNTTLKELLLGNNFISGEISCADFAKGLAKNKSLGTLYLDGNNLAEKEIVRIRDAFFCGDMKRGTLARKLDLTGVPNATSAMTSGERLSWKKPCKSYKFDLANEKDFILVLELMEMLWVLQDFVYCSRLLIRSKPSNKRDKAAYIDGTKALPRRGCADIMVEFSADVTTNNMYGPDGICTLALYKRTLQCLHDVNRVIQFDSKYFSGKNKDENALKCQSQLRLLALVCKNYTFSKNQANEIFRLYDETFPFKVEALGILASSILNPETNAIPFLRDNTGTRLGLLVESSLNNRYKYFPNNATGTYALNLSSWADIQIIRGLLELSKQSETILKERKQGRDCFDYTILSCFRNLQINGVDIDATYIREELPTSGTLTTDFVYFPDILSVSKPDAESRLIGTDDCSRLAKMWGITSLVSRFEVYHHKKEQWSTNGLEGDMPLYQSNMQEAREAYIGNPHELTHHHSVASSCNMSCKMHPRHRDYAAAASPWRFQSMDMTGRFVCSHITADTMKTMHTIRRELSEGEMFILCDTIPDLFQLFAPLKTRLRTFNYFVNIELLKVLTSKILDAWNILKICRANLGAEELNVLLRTFGIMNIVNPLSLESINGTYQLDFGKRDEKQFAQIAFAAAFESDGVATWKNPTYNGQPFEAHNYTTETLPKGGTLNFEFYSEDESCFRSAISSFHCSQMVDDRFVNFHSIAKMEEPAQEPASLSGSKESDQSEEESTNTGGEKEVEMGDRVGCVFYPHRSERQ
jgi:hypothetical protein